MTDLIKLFMSPTTLSFYEKGNYLCCYILYLLNMNLLRGLCASYSKAFPFKFWSMNLIIKYTLP